MGNNKNITEKEISKLICERGLVKNDHVFVVPVRKDVIIEFDGRICVDSYEDLPTYAPCIVTCLYADAITEHVWFNQTTNFNTMFADMHNDDYNLHILSQKNYQQIVDYLNTIPVNKKKKSSYKNEWLKLAHKFLRQNIWYSEFGNFNRQVSYSDFIHSVDCWFCCDNNPLNNDIDKIIEEKYLNNLDEPSMIAIKMLYPTITEFEDAMYLSNQTLNRSILQYKFVNTVMKKVWDTISNKTIENLYKQDPNEICKKPTYKFKFKTDIEYINPEIKEINTPSKHKVKSKYRLSDFNNNISLNDLWINASYGLYINQDVYKNKEYHTSIIPVILKDIVFVPDIEISNNAFEFEPYTYNPTFTDYFNSISNYFGECYLILTFENQITKEIFDIKYSSDFRTFYYHNGNKTYKLLLHNKPYKYPNIKNEFIENECNRIISELKEKYQKYINELRLKNDKSIITKTHNINGLVWTDNIVIETKSYYGINRYNNYTFKYNKIFNLIPEGYRLPTSDEVLTLISNNKIEFDENSLQIGDITIYDERRNLFDNYGIWTSDSYSGDILDPLKIVVIPYNGGYKQLTFQDQMDNYLLLIKE